MKVRPHNSHPAVGDLDFEAILSIQLTIRVLSHNAPRDMCLEFMIQSKATPTARISAASSKSEFVRQPYGVSSETTSNAMSSRNSSRHTKGGILSHSENQMLPAPSAAAL